MRIPTNFAAAVIGGALTAAGATGTARARNITLQINDSFPAAVSVYTTGGTKGPGGATATAQVLPASSSIYMDSSPDSVVYAVRSGPPVSDFDMTLTFWLVGQDGTVPERVVFILKAVQPRYPTACCWGDNGQVHALSGLLLVYDVMSGQWSLYHESNYVTDPVPIASATQFAVFGLRNTLRVISGGTSLQVQINGTQIMSAATDPLPGGVIGIEAYRTDLLVGSISLLVDCSDPGLPDGDGDGIVDSCDLCPAVFDPGQMDADHDTMGDACDPCPVDPGNDSDRDGICGNVDNCPLVANPGQGDSDHDGEGDVCDLNDGIPYLVVPTRQQVQWQTDVIYNSFNLYAGDLGILKSQGLYTQAPFSNPVARRYCGLYTNSAYPDGSPGLGEAVFYLVNGNQNRVEGSLGTDSNGRERPNANSCGNPHGVISIHGDAEFTAANGVMGGSGTAEDPYVIADWLIDVSEGYSYGIGVFNTTMPFVIRRVHVLGGPITGSATYEGIYLTNVANGRIEGSEISNYIFHDVHIEYSRDIVVDGNTMNAQDIGDIGISVESSDRVTIVNNEISNGSSYGIQLPGTTGSVVYHNSLMYNSSFAFLQAADNSAANAWDAGYPAGGNYWTDYHGVDTCSGPAQDICTGRDGIGDTPYIINNGIGSGDLYPLMVKPGAAGDLTPPSLSLLSPLDGSVITAQTIYVSGSASDGESGLRRVEIRLDGGDWAMASGTLSWYLPLTMTPGVHLIEARAIDHAGNLSAVASATVTYVASKLEVTVHTDSPTYTPASTVSITVTLTNSTAYPVTLHFLDTCQALFRVETPGGSVLFDLLHYACYPATTQLTLQPGQSAVTLLTWNQKSDAGVQVPYPADYVIRGYIPSEEPTPAATTTIRIASP